MGALSFRRTFVAVVVVLAVLVAVFAVLDRGQGPKLSAVQFDTAAAVAQPAQALRMTIDQQIRPLSSKDVVVRPSVAVVVASSGQSVVLTFTNALAYGTRYRVTLKSVTSAADGQASTLSYPFTTASADAYLLRRSAAPGRDQILRLGSSLTRPSVVYSAPRIQAFASLGSRIAVVTLGRTGLGSLVDVSASGTTTPVHLPGTGTLDRVQGDPTTGELGFTFTSSGAATTAKYTATLFLTNGSGTPVPVDGLDGKPLSALDWSFVPGSNDIVVQASDDSILLVDPGSPASTVPLGSYLELGAVSGDGKSVVVTDQSGPVRLALPGGKATRITASDITDKAPVGGDADIVPGGWIQDDSLFDTRSGSFIARLVFDDGRSTRELYRTPNPLGSILGFTVSPNNEYVAIETVPDVSSQKFDGYLIDGEPTSVTTAIVDVATGKLVNTFPGFGLAW